MKKKLLSILMVVILVLILVSFFSFTTTKLGSAEQPEMMYQCSDGTRVVDASLCPDAGCDALKDTKIRILQAKFKSGDIMELMISNDGTRPLEGFDITTHTGVLSEGDTVIPKSPTNTWATDQVLPAQTFGTYQFDLSSLAVDYIVVRSKECPDISDTIGSQDIIDWE